MQNCFDHIGNRRFRVTVDIHLPKYVQSLSRAEKSTIIATIVEIIRSTGAVGFVKQDPETGAWYDVGDHAARTKVGQTIRDILKQRDPQRRARKNLRRQQARLSKRFSSEDVISTSDPWGSTDADVVPSSSSCREYSGLLSLAGRRPSASPGKVSSIGIGFQGFENQGEATRPSASISNSDGQGKVVIPGSSPSLNTHSESERPPSKSRTNINLWEIFCET
mmetsp:Transcript_22339/g.51514  ORF Transcript_22339/g.51514 Transcript_22339/m.51514 type:complete len:221 (-) Transcript_22339:123-785(-)|eukprot:CAMPEP_0116859596 /NCGR_PEP_ID=MMETSP0418-20121206/21913_1 /TAXON_ID=1158023 /ORGANISM="Astrosyne radiata, Strain 13vi08-1A" /LENGTH=220 /DNA_ID=CAMNT_0004493841 /DNA_START=182 /DNA_END=844 /DNA_ORIENTATION=+